MTDELKNLYFNWLYQLVDSKYKRKSYRRLLMYLHDTQFVYTIPMDENRAEDGTDLRYRFGFEFSYNIADVDNKPCSILEMMVALSIRCEEHIMSDLDVGDRTGQWFWNMITNLGLDSMDDMNYNKSVIQKSINIFLNHQYQPDGHGGLFTVKHSRRDMRDTDIWYQMCWYLDEILGYD